MKKILLGLIALASVSAFAGVEGLPSQDPVVKMLREKFEASVQPTIEDLHLGKSWACKEFNASNDSFQVSDSEDVLKLDTYDGIITNTGTARSDNMAFDGKALTGLRTTDKGLFYIRVSADGDLLVENTSKNTVNASNGIASISDSLLYVYSYLVCPKSKIH